MKNQATLEHQSVCSLIDITPRVSAKLEKLGIQTIHDLIFYLPYRYENRTTITPIIALKEGEKALVCGTIEFTDVLIRPRRNLVCRISDKTGSFNLKFFKFNRLSNLNKGSLVSCFGEVRYNSYQRSLEMIHPEYKIITDTTNITQSHLTPVYQLTKGLQQKTLRKAVQQALAIALQQPYNFKDYLPEQILKLYNYPSLKDALCTLHAPKAKQNNKQLYALKRLAFEELLAHHLTLLKNKLTLKKWKAPIFTIDKTQQDKFIASLPFQLTTEQQRVISEISADCSIDSPMLRLIQGDVGSGKTIVAAYSALLAIASGFQVAVMAPTELLASQHFQNFKLWLKNFTLNNAYLSSQIKAKTRTKTLQSIKDGTANIIIGTHALFQNQVNFKQLGLVIIDEQHRFGVHQRMVLREKGGGNNYCPHQLVMTATPIPRTLAMLNYSDLDISIISKLPPGRKPVTTRVIPSTNRDKLINKIKQWIAKNKQAYWVCTLIEESDTRRCQAAEKTLEYLTQVIPNIKIAMIHGRMKAAEKESTMHAFKNHEIDLLVATTVIEVGVDVPNANLIIIENAEHFGLSQLHQLRGRVGRGGQESFCLLMYQAPLSNLSRHRLSILRKSNDGFFIAEKDLELRGPGDVMGTKQTGQIPLKIANLSRDAYLLDNVYKVADMLTINYPQTIQHIIDRWTKSHNNYSKI